MRKMFRYSTTNVGIFLEIFVSTNVEIRSIREYNFLG